MASHLTTAASVVVDVVPAGAVSKKSKLPFSKADESYFVENNIRFGELLFFDFMM
jgi:hypothetical protein